MCIRYRWGFVHLRLFRLDVIEHVEFCLGHYDVNIYSVSVLVDVYKVQVGVRPFATVSS